MEMHCLKGMETTLGIQNRFLLKREHFFLKIYWKQGFHVLFHMLFPSMLIDETNNFKF